MRHLSSRRLSRPKLPLSACLGATRVAQRDLGALKPPAEIGDLVVVGGCTDDGVCNLIDASVRHGTLPSLL